MLNLEKIKINKILSLKNLQNKKYIFSALIIVVLLFFFFIHLGKIKPNTDMLSNSDNQHMKATKREEEKFLILALDQDDKSSIIENQVSKSILTTETTPSPGLWERIKRDMTKMEVEYNYIRPM